MLVSQVWSKLNNSFIVHYFNSGFKGGRRNRKIGPNPGRPMLFELFNRLCPMTEATIEDDYKERVDRKPDKGEVFNVNVFKEKPGVGNKS